MINKIQQQDSINAIPFRNKLFSEYKKNAIGGV